LKSSPLVEALELELDNMRTRSSNPSCVCVPQNVRLCYVDISRTSGNLVVICRRRELNI